MPIKTRWMVRVYPFRWRWALDVDRHYPVSKWPKRGYLDTFGPALSQTSPIAFKKLGSLLRWWHPARCYFHLCERSIKTQTHCIDATSFTPITKSSFSLQRVRHLPLFHCVANTNAWPQSHASPANEALCQRSARCSSWPGVTNVTNVTNSQLSKTQHISALYQGISLRTHRVTHRVTHLCSSPYRPNVSKCWPPPPVGCWDWPISTAAGHTCLENCGIREESMSILKVKAC